MSNVIVIHQRHNLIAGAYQTKDVESLRRRLKSDFIIMNVCNVILSKCRQLLARHEPHNTLPDASELVRVSPSFRNALKTIQFRTRLQDHRT